MSEYFEMAAAIARAQAAVLQPARSVIGEACDVIDEARERIAKDGARIRDLEAALRGMVEEHDESVSDSEGHYPSPDSGCVECTLGTVPDRFNTGLCAYHKAKRLLGIAP